MELLKKHEYNLEKMSSAVISAKGINSIDANSTDPIPVIYQSGYLTIKSYDPEFGTYTLGLPNENQQIIRIGINFDSKTRNIDKALVG